MAGCAILVTQACDLLGGGGPLLAALSQQRGVDLDGCADERGNAEPEQVASRLPRRLTGIEPLSDVDRLRSSSTAKAAAKSAAWRPSEPRHAPLRTGAIKGGGLASHSAERTCALRSFSVDGPSRPTERLPR